MRKLIALILAAVVAMTALCGCNILEMGTAPTLPKLHYDESTLTGKVEFVNGRTCRISILEGDGHYDAATEKRSADVLYVTFAGIEFLGWCWYPMIALILLGAMLFVIGLHRPTRETMERKFFI